MRATYQIMAQTRGEEARVLYSSTRKRDTERHFNSMYRERKRLKSMSVCRIREGYFTQSYCGTFSIVDTDYWICKA